ncbi:MAG: UDP-N-acetylmuramoyl-tripeptide--D-alanyl-D-alanine ligase [bacterium]|nr:UDP-N-acetylmuramoyl-tripeptide--D-alanyl-D-alanine ligase [bacterium]
MKSFIKKIVISVLEAEAKVILKKYNPFIVAITGSVGKTSAKDAIYTVLDGTSSHVRKSQKSFNSEIGVPLTVLGCDNAWSNPFLWLKNILYGLELILLKSEYPNCLILEVGADHPGDIQRITKWLKPDIAVITKVSAVPVHVEFFPSRGHLLKEKSYLVKALKKDGTAILSEDDEDVKAMSKDIPQKSLTFGVRHSSSVSASHDSIVYEEKGGIKIPVGMAFKLNYTGNSLPVMARGVLGIQQVYPYLAATAVGISRNIILTDIVKSLNTHVAPRGRMNIVPGVNNTVIIDDTYNSSPDALHEALLVLGKIETTGKKIAVLGDMMELGKFSIDEHKKAGELARRVASVVVTVGQRSKIMGDNIISFNTSSEAGEYVRRMAGRGDAILVKGSQSMRMEKVVKDLLAEPEKAAELLVRQDPEWLARK